MNRYYFDSGLEKCTNCLLSSSPSGDLVFHADILDEVEFLLYRLQLPDAEYDWKTYVFDFISWVIENDDSDVGHELKVKNYEFLGCTSDP